MSAYEEPDWPSKSQFARRLVTQHSLDLRGRSILTEAGTGPYSANPSIAVWSGATAVHCVVGDGSAFEFDSAVSQVRRQVEALGLSQDPLCFHKSPMEAPLDEIDIVTNSGRVRPINPTLIGQLTPGKAVICLMWEPWELRPGEVSVQEANSRGIPVVGTNEHAYPNDLRGHVKLLALRLLSDHGEPVVGSRIVVVGDQDLIAPPIVKLLSGLSAQTQRLRTSSSPSSVQRALASAHYVLLAEHASQRVLIGPGGLIEPWMLTRSDDSPPRVGVLAGRVDVASVRELGIDIFPSNLSVPGFFAFPPWANGYPLVMAVFAAGLKVGEIVTDRLQSGDSPNQAVAAAISSGYGLPLEEV